MQKLIRANAKKKICQTVKDAELLVYLVDEEKDIYIGVLVLVCHLATRAQPHQGERLY